MLEAKISEAGPGDQRPNPLSISVAISRLLSERSIQALPKRTHKETPFYALPSAALTDPSFVATLNTRRHLYLLHKSFTERNEHCSDVLEQLLDAAIDRAGTASFLSRFPRQKLPLSRPLDFVIDIDGVRFGGEAKNYREWLYPDSSEIWAAISKCCEIDAVPVLATRKLPYVCFLLFRNVGMIGYQTHFQFFHPAIEPELERVKHKDGLGYKDIRCTLEPDGNMIRFFASTLPRIGVKFAARFRAQRDTLTYFADSQGLANKDLPQKKRSAVFAEAWKTLFGSSLSDDLHL